MALEHEALIMTFSYSPAHIARRFAVKWKQGYKRSSLRQMLTNGRGSTTKKSKFVMKLLPNGSIGY